VTPRRIEGRAEELIRDLHERRGWRPAQIHAELKRWFEDRTGFAIPSERTVRRICDELEPKGDSPPWRLRDANPDEAAAVLAVIAWRIQQGVGTSISGIEAQWIARIRRACDAPPSKTYFLARAYLRAADDDEQLAALDAFVALAPWRDAEQHARYVQLLSNAGAMPGFRARDRDRYDDLDPWLLRLLIAPEQTPTDDLASDDREAAGMPWAKLAEMAELESPGSTTPPAAPRRPANTRRGRTRQ